MLSRNNNPPYFGSRQQGFTLLEVVVVIAVLAVTAGMILSQMGTIRCVGAGQDRTAEQIATVATMDAVRDAIVGASGQAGLWQDLGERTNLLLTIADLFMTNNLTFHNVPVSLQGFDPVIRLGWRGPYLTSGGTLYAVDSANNFTSAYGANGDPAVSDAWGRPIVLQLPTLGGILDWQHARLVSAGPDGKIDTPLDIPSPNDTDRNDDILLFLFVTDTH